MRKISLPFFTASLGDFFPVRKLSLSMALFAFGLVFCISNGQAQVKNRLSFSEEWRFAKYLLDGGQHLECVHVLSNIDTVGLNSAQKDSLYFLSGWASFEWKKLDSASLWLKLVSPEFEGYKKSQVYAAYSDLFQGRYQPAATILNGGLYQTDSNANFFQDDTERELWLFERAGLYLLERNLVAFDSLSKQFTYQSFVFQKEEENLIKYRQVIANRRAKSPLLAGVYSAVLPGAGKWYAGKKKQGIAAFLPIVSLAAITYEAYRKQGVRSARFIGFGSLFTLFYVGNIWGSVLSVKVQEKEFNQSYDKTVQFDMQIPLRNFYN